MGIHSKILVHWTGKDFESCPCEASKSQLYVKLLKDDLEKGLYAQRTVEASIRHLKVKDLIRICFTEVRLSQAKKHAEEYGGLGIGFTRDFIINKGGRPVIYTPFEDKDGLLEASIRKLHTLFRNDDEIKHSIDCILAHVKRMSNTKITDTGSYKDYYDESEWRLVYGGKPDNEHFKQREDEPKDIFRLPFIASDVVIIIFPNEQIKDMALNDEYIKNFFSQDVPNMVTLENCDNF